MDCFCITEPFISYYILVVAFTMNLKHGQILL